jgi:hypothetical protein
MSENRSDFIPLSGQLGIAGSSYMLQIGKVGTFWALRLVKGADVLDSKVFKDKGAEMPNSNILTGWVLSVLAIPNINTYQIQKTIGFIRQQAMRTVDEQQSKKKTQGKAESSKVTLEKTPESEIKRSKGPGWVKEEAPAAESESESTETSEENAEIEQPAPVTKAKPVSPPKSAGSPKVKPLVKAASISGTTHRELQPIPRGEESEEGAAPSKPSKVEKQKPAKKVEAKASGQSTDKLDDILKRLDTLEQRVHQLEKENKALREEMVALKSPPE